MAHHVGGGAFCCFAFALSRAWLPQSTAARRPVTVAGTHKVLKELALGRNGQLGVTLAQMLNVALIIGHPCKLSERGPNHPDEAKNRTA